MYLLRFADADIFVLSLKICHVFECLDVFSHELILGVIATVALFIFFVYIQRLILSSNFSLSG